MLFWRQWRVSPQPSRNQFFIFIVLSFLHRNRSVPIKMDQNEIVEQPPTPTAIAENTCSVQTHRIVFDEKTIAIIETLCTADYIQFSRNPLFTPAERALIRHYRKRAIRRRNSKKYRLKKAAAKAAQIEAFFKVFIAKEPNQLSEKLITAETS